MSVVRSQNQEVGIDSSEVARRSHRDSLKRTAKTQRGRDAKMSERDEGGRMRDESEGNYYGQDHPSLIRHPRLDLFAFSASLRLGVNGFSAAWRYNWRAQKRGRPEGPPRNKKGAPTEGRPYNSSDR